MLIPAKCFVCGGSDSACPKCYGTGTLAIEMPVDDPCWTRKCPDCGWTNGLYFPKGDGMFVPNEGQPVRETYEHRANMIGTDFCMRCLAPDGRPKRGHMIWTKLS